MREKIRQELMKITDQELREFTRNALDQVPDKFYTMPASTSGKYHHSSDNEVGGLVMHTLKVCRVADDFLRCWNRPDLIDVMRATCLLHDVAKAIGEPHDQVGALWLEGLIEQKTSDMFLVINGVRWHSGPWSAGAVLAKHEPNPAINFPQDFGCVAQIAHMADYVASRKFIELLL